MSLYSILFLIISGIDSISRNVVTVRIENTESNIVLVKTKLKNLTSSDFITRLESVFFFNFCLEKKNTLNSQKAFYAFLGAGDKGYIEPLTQRLYAMT